MLLTMVVIHSRGGHKGRDLPGTPVSVYVNNAAIINNVGRWEAGIIIYLFFR